MARKQHESAEVVWRDRLRRFSKSKLTVRAFCRQEGVSDASYYQWRKRLMKRPERGTGARSDQDSRAPRAQGPPRFVPVNVSQSAVIEVELPNGIRIRVPAMHGEALRVALAAGSGVCREVR